jgi:hypothetical protein
MADLVYLLEVNAYDPALPGVRTLSYASGLGFVTQPSETPANTWYEPRIVQPANFTRTAFADARVMGGSTTGYGEITLNNADQGLSALLDYGMDGRLVVIRVGTQGAAYPSGYTTFLTGTIEQPEMGVSKVTLRLRDLLQNLTLPLQQNYYGGTNVLPNGADGTPNDIQGQPKPLAWGRCFYLVPVCVNTADLIYQVHDGSVQSIDAVYDSGVALAAGTDRATLAAMEANEPAPGYFDTCLALGLFRLGATPGGAVTADVHGGNAGGYVNTVADIVVRILKERAGVSSGAIGSTSVAALDAAFPAEVGFAINQAGGSPVQGFGLGFNQFRRSGGLRERFLGAAAGAPSGTGATLQQAIDAVLLSAGAWLAPNRLGRWQIAQLVAPSGTPAASFTDNDIISIERTVTSDPTAGAPVWAVALRYLHYTGFADWTTLAGSVSPAVVEQFSREWRGVVAFDSTVLTTHLLAPILYRDTLLTNATDAANEAARLLALHKVRRDFVHAVLRLDATKATLDLGSQILVTTPRLGYGAGRQMTVVGITSDGRKDELTLDLWG